MSMLTSVSPMVCCQLKRFFLKQQEKYDLCFLQASVKSCVGLLASLFFNCIFIRLIFKTLLWSIHCSLSVSECVCVCVCVCMYYIYIYVCVCVCVCVCNIYMHTHTHLVHFPDSIQGGYSNE